MNTATNKQEQYNEAKAICTQLNEYKGDKRRLSYKMLEKAVFELYIHRMNYFATQLGLPTYREVFHNY